MTGSAESGDLEQIVAEVRAGRKYAHVNPGLVRRLCTIEIGRHRKRAEVEQAVRNKLHQVGGAYMSEVRYERWLADMATAASHGGDALKAACAQIMRSHASTRERLPALPEFYARIFASVPRPDVVLDIACGLNPLAIPWMGLAPSATYVCCDIYDDMVSFLQRAMLHFEVRGEARSVDVVGETPTDWVDLAFLLKAVPCLSQLEPGAGARVFAGLRARHIVVSFPTRSLGGRNIGMAGFYTRQFSEILGPNDHLVERIDVAGEVAFVVERSTAQ